MNLTFDGDWRATALREQREDRHRADALLGLIATYVDDYGNW
ncbi:hypothetical protein AB0L47_19310 [Streptomyces bobili]